MYYTLENVRKKSIRFYDTPEPILLTTPALMSYMYRKEFCTEREKLKELGGCIKNNLTSKYKYSVDMEQGLGYCEMTGDIHKLLDDIIDNKQVVRVVY